MTKKIYTCERCGKTFERSISRAERSPHHYCSLDCFNRTGVTMVTLTCEKCGKVFTRPAFNSKRSLHHYCSTECSYKRFEGKHHTPETIAKMIANHPHLSGETAGSWKGGTWLTTQGYVKVLTSDGYVLEHRLVMEQYLGRKLTKDEVVHHKNGIKTDNRIENLDLMSEEAHGKLHRYIQLKELSV